MITDTMQIRPRYGEVDQMGYVYHANYVSYCHEARTELMRKLNLHDDFLENNQIMLPVISFDIKYKSPAHYDELLTIKTTIDELPKIRFSFRFEIFNSKNKAICTANSTVVFANSTDRKPTFIPDFVEDKLLNYFNAVVE